MNSSKQVGDKPSLKISVYLKEMSDIRFIIMEKDGRYQLSWRKFSAGKITDAWDGDSLWTDLNTCYGNMFLFFETMRGRVIGYAIQEQGLKFDVRLFNNLATRFRMPTEPDYS